MMNIESFIFGKTIYEPIKLVITEENQGKFITKRGFFNIFSIRQNSTFEVTAESITKQQAIKDHEAA